MNVLILMGSSRLHGNTVELCKHCNLEYKGLYSVRVESNPASVQTVEAVFGAKAFARKVIESWN